MLVHTEQHINHMTNMKENSFLSDGCRRERRHGGKSFQVTWQASGDKNALIHETHSVFTSSLIPGVDLEIVCL